MLIVQFKGGLGNQLFQYAFLEYLKLSNQEVYADISDFIFHHHHYGYEIEKIFECEINKIGKKQIRSLSIGHNNLIIKVLEKILKIRISKENEFHEIDRILTIESIPIGIDMYFSGYWQNVHYVKAVQTILKEKLKFKEAIQGKNLECYENFKDTCTVSVHVRRTDYLKNKKLGGVCDENYYFKAIKYMKQRLTTPKFLFFSDDIEWCKNTFGYSADNCYVDWNTGENSFRDMHLMSLCKNNIIANSSFSWWGAWLNNNKKKIVIMPKQWTKFSESILMPSEWIRL